MAATLTWSDSGTFSNGAGGESTVVSWPAGTYGVSIFLAVLAGKGGSGHSVKVNRTGGATTTLTGIAGLNNLGGDEYVTGYESSTITSLDNGGTVSVATTGATISPEIGLLGVMIVSFLDGYPIGASANRDITHSTDAVNYAGNVSWSGSPRFGYGAFGEFVHDAAPSLPDWSGAESWQTVLSVATADGRGLGQSVVSLGFYTLPSDSPSLIPNPVPWQITNVTAAVLGAGNGRGGELANIVTYPLPFAVVSGRSWVQVIG